MDSRNIQFCFDKSRIDFNQVQELFILGAFWAKDRAIEDIKIAIIHSDPVVTVWDRDRIIGFARATSDGVYRAGIWDVVIHPDYRGRGLGGKLVETVLTHPKVNKVERVYLTTTNQQSFYERIGFKRNDTTTMILENSRLVNVASLLEPQAQKR
ncbi:MAG: GNAT family N-acetyltransferase [Xenococcus sp. (in: cyanobacteria)]